MDIDDACRISNNSILVKGVCTGMAQGPGNLEKVPEEILALFPGDSRSFFPENPIKFQK